MAYNNNPFAFERDEENNRIREYAYWARLDRGPRDYDILSTFFSNLNLTPTWQHANQDWGSFNETTGLWSGIMALVRKHTGVGCGFFMSNVTGCLQRGRLGSSIFSM
jgi:hypothetical protein